MKNLSRWRWLFQVGALILVAEMNACAVVGALPWSGESWQEEVLLHDGSKLIVERTVERGGRHEIGQKPSFTEQRLRFTVPGSNQRITWEDHRSPDLGQANFLPMAVDVFNGTPYLVVYPMGCLSYNKWGRPNPPYVIFRYQNKEWTRIPLEALPDEITTPNMIFSMPDEEVKKLGTRFVSAEVIKSIIARYQQTEYKTILRESVKPGRQCDELIHVGKGRWIGTGWFRNQPSRSACFKFCDQENVLASQCPCTTLFKKE